MHAHLEGLILHDGNGRFYEVPRAVLERYRVEEQPVRGYMAQPLSDQRVSTSDPTLWQVVGGVYAALSTSPAARA